MDPQTHLACALAGPGEDKSWLPPGWLKGSEITAESRESLVDWLIQITSYLGLSDNTLHLAVSHLDLVVSKVEVDMEEMQLMCLACLLVSAKWVEDLAPAPSLLLPLVGDLGPGVSCQDLTRLEREVLLTLEWDLDRTTPSTFLHYTGEVLKDKRPLLRLAKALLDFSLTQPWYGTVQPSRLSSTCLLASCCLLGVQWTEEMSSLTGHKPSTLLAILPKVLGALRRGQQQGLDGAKNKYRKSLKKIGEVSEEKIELITSKVQDEFVKSLDSSRGCG